MLLSPNRGGDSAGHVRCAPRPPAARPPALRLAREAGRRVSRAAARQGPGSMTRTKSRRTTRISCPSPERGEHAAAPAAADARAHACMHCRSGCALSDAPGRPAGSPP